MGLSCLAPVPVEAGNYVFPWEENVLVRKYNYRQRESGARRVLQTWIGASISGLCYVYYGGRRLLVSFDIDMSTDYCTIRSEYRNGSRHFKLVSVRCYTHISTSLSSNFTYCCARSLALERVSEDLTKPYVREETS